MSVSMNQRGCSSALRFIRCKVYSGKKFSELKGQLVARASSRVVKRHLCRDQHSIHQPHLILAKGLVLIGGPPQGRYEQSDDRNLDREDSESFQGGFSRSRHRSHTPLSGGGLAELLYFSLIFGDADIASVPANVGFRGKSGNRTDICHVR
jgi:hypothetical protein